MRDGKITILPVDETLNYFNARTLDQVNITGDLVVKGDLLVVGNLMVEGSITAMHTDVLLCDLYEAIRICKEYGINAWPIYIEVEKKK